MKNLIPSRLILCSIFIFICYKFNLSQCANGNWSVVGPTGMPLYKDSPASFNITSLGVGRIHQVLSDPTNNNIVFLAAASGGLWKRDATGVSPVVTLLNTDFLERIGIAKVAIAPLDHNTRSYLKNS